ncbi:hypothetical protein [Sphingobacterium multivorum]|uniref:hypothetical protein n=1 Tax=Sphingobacterium multivorum TaxID=28454 RepID=UPI0028AACD8A|nr:hypothetical protein [Sphingobacterium multivorum]
MKFFKKVMKGCLSLLFIFLCCHCWGQESSDRFIQSPNAASLGFYGKTDVSFFTGLLDIAIPVTTLRYRDIELPISLKYNSGGVLLEQHPSWVGQNWTLNVGGVITRKVKGGIDEIYVDGFTDNNEFAYYYKYANLNNAQWDQTSRISSYINNSSSPKALLEPDEFMFTLPNGKSGTVMLDHLGVWQVISESSYGLKTNVRLNSNTLKLSNPNNSAFEQYVRRIIYGIDIIDDDGTKYTFGDNINAIEFMRSALSSGLSMDNVFANAWSLTKITSPNGNVINFEYARGNHQFIQNVSINYTSQYSVRMAASCDGSNLTGVGYSGTVITPVYLKAIKSDAFSVEFKKEVSNEIQYPYRDPVDKTNKHAFDGFAYDDFMSGHYADVKANGTHLLASNPHVDYKLKEIIVKDAKNNVSEIYGFSYNNDGTTDYNQRLFLMGFERKSKTALDPIEISRIAAAASGDKYEFTYNNLDKLPGYNTMKTDNSGYYNNKGVEGLLLGEKFRPVYHYAAVGSLISIKYPTGGRNNFYYGLNDFSKTVQKNNDGTTSVIGLSGVGGGLRIDSVETIPVKGLRQMVTYLYKNNDTQVSSGVSAGKLENYYHYSVYSADASIKADAFVTSSYSMRDLDYTLGRPVVYSQVQEIFKDGSKNVYTYSNWDSLKYRDQPIASRYDRGIWVRTLAPNGSGTFTPSMDNLLPDLDRISMESERGKLLRLEQMSGNTLRYRKTYQYQDTAARFQRFIRSYVTKSSTIFCPIQSVTHMTVQPKRSYTYIPFVKSMMEEYFDKTGSLESSKKVSYTYNNLGLLEQQQITGSDDKVKKESFKYASDFTNVTVLTEMKQKNMLSQLVESEKKVQDVSLEKTKYNYEKTQSTQNYNLKSKELWVKTNLANRASFEYDLYGNVVQSKDRENGVPISYLWAYKGQYPVMKVTNVRYVDLVDAIGINVVNSLLQEQPTEQRLRSLIVTIKNSYPQAMTEFFLYSDLIGLSGKSDARGQLQGFEYDDYNRLALTKNFNNHVEKSFDYNLSNVKDTLTMPVVQPVPLYAKLVTGTKGSFNDNGVVKTTTPYFVSFYSDAACTVPYTLLIPMKIKFKEKTTISSSYTQIIENDHYIEIPAGVSTQEFTTGLSYCEGGLPEIERVSQNNVVARGLPPGEGGPVITCYNSVVTLFDWDGYIAK